MSKIQITIIVILILVAGALAYLIMEESSRRSRPKAILQPTVLSSEYTEAEKELFSLHLSTSTQAFSEKVALAAVKGTSVSMDGCMPDPVVIHAYKGQSITFNNASDTEISIRFKGGEYVIGPKSSQQTPPLTLGNRYLERMVITYSCTISGYQSRAGFVYVSP